MTIEIDKFDNVATFETYGYVLIREELDPDYMEPGEPPVMWRIACRNIDNTRIEMTVKNFTKTIEFHMLDTPLQDIDTHLNNVQMVKTIARMFESIMQDD
ncbi:hypothetical protein ACWJWM_19900 [Clostridioides difficile]